MSGRPIRIVSPRKNVRRSIREKTTVYRSLAENQLGSNLINSLIEQTNKYRANIKNGRISGYTRSGRKIERYIESSDDEEFMRWSSRTRRRSRNDDDDDENSPIRHRAKRQKIIIEDDSEQSSQLNEDSMDAGSSSLYDRLKQRREIISPKSKTPTKFSDAKSPELTREDRLKNREIKKVRIEDVNNEERDEQLEDKPSTEEENEDEKTADEEEGPRTYQLRQRLKKPTEYKATERSRSRPSYREDRYIRRNRDRNRKQRRSERRVCRSDSSSTGSEEDGEMKRRNRNDEERFERRKERSIHKARNRFAPLNLTEKDLSSSQAVILERLRQTGASCSDIDPMAIDKLVGFTDIGGLGPHIQSLKEVVLFPMLYPDIFQNFNINPPKGVLFYGPPGTGKTLIARALANECSRGDKKVAFFMRKGADCLSKWVGESERQLRILFDQAYSMRPSIIFFDEIDGLAPVRSTRQDQIHSSIVSTLLALMDGLDNRGEVIVIGATNRLDSIDPALRRPGRFDRELRFTLPDSAARLQILKIHTSKWGDSKPADKLMQWIAENTSGYCGADLKFLCTEAVMIALRNHYPHIYMSSDRLKLNLDKVKVSKENLMTAMKRITPASRRDLSIPCRPLDDRTSILLECGLMQLLEKIPDAYRCSRSVEVTGSCELEKVVRALDDQPPISAARLLLVGNKKCPDGGQTSYVLPALLSKLDHLSVHCISISKMFADGRPEEAFATIFQDTLRAAASGPCVLLCPSINEWFRIVPLSVTHMLKVALDQITGFTPILFLASAECIYEECCPEVQKIFRIHNSTAIPTMQLHRRAEYFKYVCNPALEAPKLFDASKYVEPEKARVEDLPPRKLSEKEAKELEKLYENQLREFRIFLRDQLGKLVRDRRFTYFIEPVDSDEAPDYFEIISEPMCFTQMQEKVDSREYTHPDQFLADINLIVKNALEYNPIGDLHSKAIRHSAISLRDIVEEYFEKEFDEDFVEKLEETARLLFEANIVPQNEQLLNLPDGFVRKTRWNVVTGFKGGIPNGDKATSSFGNNRIRMFRGSTYTFPCDKKKQKSRAIVKSIAQSLTQSELPLEALEVANKQEEHTMEEQNISYNNISIAPEQDELQLLIDKSQLEEVITSATQKTDDWGIPELEALAAAMANIIEKYRMAWNREVLPQELLNLIGEWVYEP